METHYPTTQENSGQANREKLAQDLRVLIHDAEELLKSGAGVAGSKAEELKARMQASLEKMKVTANRIEAKAIEGAKAADKVIREHPYESIGVAFGIGLLIGVLINRK